MLYSVFGKEDEKHDEAQQNAVVRFVCFLLPGKER